jgi:type I restriction enzyme, S subunit
MIAPLKPYPAYKDSGMPWLGAIPSHWQARRIGSLGVFIKGRGIARADIADEGLPAITYGDIYTKYNIQTKSLRKYTSPEVAANAEPIFNGDLLLTASGETLDEIGKTVLYSGGAVGFAGGDIIVLRLTEGGGLYLSYALNSELGVRQKSTLGRGDIIAHISPSKLKQIIVPLPPLPEQHAIARFLDHIDGRINRYIRAKRKLIALLNEQKQAIIHQAVTRGLDPDVPLKPSGVEWLGEIPAHWEVRRLKYLARFAGGGTPSKDEVDYWNGDIPWVSPKDMKSTLISDTQDHITELALQKSSTQLIPAGTPLLVVRSGILKHSIPVAIAARDVAINQDMKAIRLNGELTADYFLALVQGSQRQLRLEWTKRGATVESIEHGLLANCFLPIPPPREQLAIVEELRKGLANVERAIDDTRHEIDLIREYRTRLIADVVTGKLDVRDAELPPEQDLGPEEPDDEALEEWADEPADWQEEVDAGN